MALNEDVAWPNVHPGEEKKTKEVNLAFLDGSAEKKLLSSGMQLYKFTTKGRGLVHQGRVSPWWFPVDPLGEFDVGLDGVLKFASTVGVSSTEYARLIAAVTEEWNAMDVIMKAELKTNVHGFWGQCAKQPKKEGSSVNLTGRAYQLYIPGMTDEHVKELSTVAAP